MRTISMTRAPLRRVLEPQRGRWPNVATLGLLLTFAVRPVSAQGAADAQLAALPQELWVRIERRNPELAAARAELEAARARAAATGFVAPAVLSGEVEDVPGGVELHRASYRLELGRELLTGGRNAAARALAASEAATAEARVAAVERRLAGEALAHLAQLFAASAVAGRLASEDSLLESVEGSVRAQFAAGNSRYVEMLRLRTERLRVQTDRSQALAEAEIAREGILALLGGEGAPPPGVNDLPRAWEDAEPPLPGPPPEEALLEASGELLVARAAVQAAQAARTLVVAEQAPRLSGSIGAQWSGGDEGGTLGPVIGAALTLPFTSRGASTAAVEAADREVAAAEAAAEATRAHVRAELRAERLRYEAALGRVSAYDLALLEGARAEREAALAAYRSGVMSLIELLDFERALSRAETERLRARADAMEAYANLISAGSR